MQNSHQQLDFIAVHCPNPMCNAILFEYSPTLNTFTVRIKCRRCSYRRRAPVYLLFTVSLEPLLSPDIDLVTENLASA
jgi:hypothetical protein